MENSSALEKECLAQELSIGYKYFKNLREINKIYDKVEKNYQDELRKINSIYYSPTYNNLADVFKQGKIKFRKLNSFKVERHDQIQKVNENKKKYLKQIENLKKDKRSASKSSNKSSFLNLLILLLVLACVAITILDVIKPTIFGGASATVLWIFGICSFIGVIWIGISIKDNGADYFKSIFFVETISDNIEYNNKIKKIKDQIEVLSSEITAIQSKSDEQIWKEMQSDSYPVNKLLHLLHKYDPETYAEIEEIFNNDLYTYKGKVEKLEQDNTRRKKLLLEPVTKARDTLKYYKNDLLNEIHNYLSVVPLEYFNEEAITGMLYYYTTKRGDTIKELINLYENEKFKEKLLGTIQQNTLTMQSIGKVVVTQLFNISQKMDSLHTELINMKKSLEEVAKSNLTNTYTMLSLMQQQLETQEKQYKQYEETARINNEIDSTFKNLTIAIDGQPVDVKIYG